MADDPTPLSIELHESEVSRYLNLSAQDLRDDTFHGPMWQEHMAEHEKLFNFWRAEPEVERYILTKVVEKEKQEERNVRETFGFSARAT